MPALRNLFADFEARLFTEPEIPMLFDEIRRTAVQPCWQAPRLTQQAKKQPVALRPPDAGGSMEEQVENGNFPIAGHRNSNLARRFVPGDYPVSPPAKFAVYYQSASTVPPVNCMLPGVY